MSDVCVVGGWWREGLLEGGEEKLEEGGMGILDGESQRQ